MDTQTRPAWERLGRLLIERRARLDPRYSVRKDFAEQVGLNIGLIRDVETAQRDTFTPATIVSIERAYQLAPGAIQQALAGGELTEAQPPGALPALTAQMRGTVGPPADDELRAALLEVARKLPIQDLRAVLEEREGSGEPTPENPFTDPYERQIWGMAGLSENVRWQVIRYLKFALEGEHGKDLRPDAAVHQFPAKRSS